MSKNEVNEQVLAVGTMLLGKHDELVERIDKLEVDFRRPPAPNYEAQPTGKRSFASQSFIKLMRYGPERLEPGERKAVLITSEDSKGGVFAPAEYVMDEVIRNLIQFSPIRDLSRGMVTTAGSVLIPKRTATGTAFFVGETEQRSEASPGFGMENVPVNEMAAYVDISTAMAEDSVTDMGAEIALGLGEEFGRLEGYSALYGNSVKTFDGVLVNSQITTVPSGAATTVTADAVISMFYSLPAFYRNRATWVTNGASGLKSGVALIWYYRATNGNIELYDKAGYHPTLGVPLSPITREVVEEAQRLETLRQKAEVENARLAAIKAERDRLKDAMDAVKKSGGPSFDCNRAKQPIELVLCSDVDLAERDRRSA